MNKIKINLVLALFILYLYLLLKVILFKFGSIEIKFLLIQLQRNLRNPDYIFNRLELGNFMPFKTIFYTLQNSSIHGFINLFGNILIFVPLGVFLLFFSKNKEISFIKILVQSFSLSFCLECFQIVFSIGTFDVDDLILNTSGSLLGFSALKLYLKPVLWREEKISLKNYFYNPLHKTDFWQLEEKCLKLSSGKCTILISGHRSCLFLFPSSFLLRYFFILNLLILPQNRIREHLCA